MNGWKFVRTDLYDLYVIGEDMPLMNGIELVRLINEDPAPKSIPVMIVSYKDRQEDRMLGFEAGADYFLMENSIHDAILIETAENLNGES